MRNRKTGFRLMEIAIQIMMGSVAIGIIIVTIGIVGIIFTPFIVIMMAMWVTWNMARIFFENKDFQIESTNFNKTK